MRASTSSSSGAENSNKKFKGVTKKRHRWVTTVYVKMNDRVRIEDFSNACNPIYIGAYDSFEKAARAYDAAALCVFVPKPDVLLDLNFPDHPPQIFYPEGQLLTVAEVREQANRHANIEPIQPAQEPQGNDGIAMDKPPSPVSAHPPGERYFNFMDLPESTPVPHVIDHTLASPVSPFPAGKPFHNFMGVEESAPEPEPKVLNNAEQENADSST
ncbi:hypothetical protein LUZ63_017574 [Rhynchospora breviuscula]|uniref:AP2/ERF domain-containing protein n=1 Tax=Rhynchospora breviuscula TaxID=2022672 RepID=A0A9Q0C2R4_9POAL|nr:hypothetical protein LUZ63_017574 [Rhynchospora breviuscula]